jgi:hypothetical protein
MLPELEEELKRKMDALQLMEPSLRNNEYKKIKRPFRHKTPSVVHSSFSI